jgi:hypothetical protein
MSHLYLVASEGIRRDESVGIFTVCSWDTVHLCFSGLDVPEASENNPGTAEGPPSMALTPIEEQIEQIRSLAERHYPDDAGARSAWLVERLIQRLREYDAMVRRVDLMALEVRDTEAST